MPRTTQPPEPPAAPEERIVDIDVDQEMQTSFLEYAYSVIYARALPDARDGLKPVQRRILFQMSQMGLRPDRGHVKSARVVGDVMGRLHPHGDTAIYDALVRLAQPFTMRVPLVDGHGNFGSLDDGPAAPRYTEARLTAAALLMVADLDEDVVDFVPNYDNQLTQPAVLPAAFPNLLVNGSSGIAVGMATNMAPHNLGEVVAAARHLIAHPDATVEDLMRFVPGPDLPSGGRIIGLDGIREAYATGRGSFRTRATVAVENVTPRRKGLIVTELPYLVGPEKVIEKIKDGVQAKKLAGISAVHDHTDRKNGLRLVIEIKAGFNPEAVLAQLYRHTPMEDSFGINNVALVDGRPQTLGLRELLRVYVDHRMSVVRRRSEFRLARRRERLHLVEGLLVAILDIDEVIAVIRGSDDTEQARDRLINVFDLDQPQAEYILELRLRRLTKFSKIELEAERAELAAEIAELEAVLGTPGRLETLVSDELAAVAAEHGTPRRTVLLEASAEGPRARAGAAQPLEVSDDPCWVVLSSTGRLARTAAGEDPAWGTGKRSRHDVLRAAVPSTVRGQVAAVTSAGRMVRLSVLELPALPPSATAPACAGGAPVRDLLRDAVEPARGERVVSVVPLPAERDPDAAATLFDAATAAPADLVLGTRHGVVKRVAADWPAGKTEWEVVALKQGDEVVGAAPLAAEDQELTFVTSAAQLLHFPADTVRAQGRGAAGVAGIRLGEGDEVVWFGVVAPGDAAQVVTVARPAAGADGTLGEEGHGVGSVKVTPFEAFPGKGRATGGVRAQRFLAGEDRIAVAWAGTGPARAAAANGAVRTLPDPDPRRDGSGTPLDASVDAVSGPRG